MCSCSGRTHPLLAVPSCAPKYALIPTCFHGDVEMTSTTTSGWGYTCPCSCPCCFSPCFEEVPLKCSLDLRTSWDDSSGTVALDAGFTLLSSARLCCPAVTGCRLSKSQCFSCLLSSLECGVSVCTMQRLFVCACVWVRAAQCRLAMASILVHFSLCLSLSFPPTVSPSPPLISYCRLREQSTSLNWPANQSAWEWVMSQQPRPGVERERSSSGWVIGYHLAG